MNDTFSHQKHNRPAGVVVATARAERAAVLGNDPSVRVQGMATDLVLAFKIGVQAGADYIVVDGDLLDGLGPASLQNLFHLYPEMACVVVGGTGGMLMPGDWAGNRHVVVEGWHKVAEAIRGAEPRPAGPEPKGGEAVLQITKPPPPLVSSQLKRLEPAPSADPVDGHAPASHLMPPQVCVVFGPKGGVGKTTLAVNVAAMVASRTKSPTLLLDFDFRGNNAWVHLGLGQGPTVIDFLPALEAGGKPSMAEFVRVHKASGLHLLAGPDRPQLAEFVNERQAVRIVDVSRRLYQYVVIDTPPGPDSELVYACLEAATMGILVTTDDAASLQLTRMAVDTLRQLGTTSTQHVHLVLNQVSDPPLLDAGEIARFLGMPIAGSIPAAPRVFKSGVLEGHPVGLDSHDPATAALLQVAGLVSPGLVAFLPSAPGPRRYWTRMWGHVRRGSQ